MTIVAHMPDGADGGGSVDDTAALQAMFDACPIGGLCLIPDGVFRVTTTVQVPRPMNVWCSPGAHIKGDFAGTQEVVHAYWHTPSGVHDQYVQMESFYWQGGTISRLSANGTCLKVSAGIGGSVQNVRTLRGSPHIWLDAPDQVVRDNGSYVSPWFPGWYRGGTGPNWTGIMRAVRCRGYSGGQYGCRIGQTPFYDGTGQSNGMSVESCYFEGNGAAGSVGILTENGGGHYIMCNTLDSYETGVRFNRGQVSLGMANKMVSVTQDYHSPDGSTTANVIGPDGWESGRGSGTWGGMDSSGIYL